MAFNPVKPVIVVCFLPVLLVCRFIRRLAGLAIVSGINVAGMMLSTMGNAMQAVGTSTNVTRDDRETRQIEAAQMGPSSGNGRLAKKPDAGNTKRSRKNSCIDEAELEVIEGIEVLSWSDDEDKHRVRGKLPRHTTTEKHLEATLDDLLAVYTPRDSPPPRYTSFPDIDMELAADSATPPPIVTMESQDHPEPHKNERRDSGADSNAITELPRVTTSHEVVIRSREYTESHSSTQTDTDSDAKPELPHVTTSHEVVIQSREDTESHPTTQADADMDLYTQDISTPSDYDARSAQEESERDSENTPSLYDQARHERETFQPDFFNPPSGSFREYPRWFSLPWGFRGWYVNGKLIIVVPETWKGKARRR